MASSPTLPPDITFEILTRASLETVGRCRTVSKEWNTTTYESSFVNLLCERTKTTSGVFIQSKKPHDCTYMSTFVDNNGVSNYEQLSLNFLPYSLNVKIEASHQGMLICVSRNYRNRPQYYVCKPTTKEWEQIPNPKTRYMTEATSLMVLKSKPLQYKIVRLSSPKSPYYYSKQLPSQEFYIFRCEVFYSKTRAWKQLDNVTLPLNEFVCFKPAVTACGAFYWILCNKSNNQVFSFHVDEDIWEVFSLPCPDESHNLTLSEYQGRLACIRKGEDLMELFVMEDYKNKVWSKRLNIKINELDRYSASFQTLCNNSSKRVPDEIFKLQSNSEPINLRGPLKSSAIKRWFRRVRKNIDLRFLRNSAVTMCTSVLAVALFGKLLYLEN